MQQSDVNYWGKTVDSCEPLLTDRFRSYFWFAIVFDWTLEAFQCTLCTFCVITSVKVQQSCWSVWSIVIAKISTGTKCLSRKPEIEYRAKQWILPVLMTLLRLCRFVAVGYLCLLALSEIIFQCGLEYFLPLDFGAENECCLTHKNIEKRKRTKKWKMVKNKKSDKMLSSGYGLYASFNSV